jgi:hypothetical protein
MLNLTPRRSQTAMKNSFRPSRLVTTMIWILALGAFSCNKHLPPPQGCTCDVDDQGVLKFGKGGATFNGLAVCGVFNLPVVPNDGRATTLIASLGWREFGFYEYAELLSNPNQGFFVFPDVEVNTADFKYFLSASINDLKGNPLVMFKNNQWFVYLENVGKYNYDSTGFELYDRAGHICLSFDYLVTNGENNLVVQGVVPSSDSTLSFYTLSESVYINFPYGTPASNQFFEYVYNTTPIKPLFRYTGPGWQHARLQSSPTPE